MDINTIISSGLLESYVLGYSTAEENVQVKELCAKHPEILLEIEAIEHALITYASASAPEISGAFKENLFSQLNDKTVQTKNDGSVFTPVKSVFSYKYAIAATIALLVVSSVFNFLFYSKMQKTTAELSMLSNDKKQYANQLKIQESTLKSMQEDLAVLTDPNTKLVKLESTVATANSMALIYWNSNTYHTYISDVQLPTPPEGKQYQLWAIVNGKPVDAGVFDLAITNGIDLKKMKETSGVQAFAVTIENKGGSLTPTLTTMCLLGNV
ncbi:MAG: anti-sigma factor [Bacteroidota bacterium]